MLPEPDPPQYHPILVWALTKKGEMVATYFDTLAEAEYYGQINTDSGAWRTWDAFEMPPDMDATRRVLVSSHDKTKLANKLPRPRILASLTPAAIAAIDAAPATIHIDVPRPSVAAPAPAFIPPAPPSPAEAEDSRPKHSRVRVLTDWTPLLPPPPAKGAAPPPPPIKSNAKSRSPIIPE